MSSSATDETHNNNTSSFSNTADAMPTARSAAVATTTEVSVTPASATTLQQQEQQKYPTLTLSSSLLQDLLAALAPIHAMRDNAQYIPTEMIYKTPERDMAAFMRRNSKTFASKERKAAASSTNSKAKALRTAAATKSTGTTTTAGGRSGAFTTAASSGSPKRGSTTGTTTRSSALLPPKPQPRAGGPLPRTAAATTSKDSVAGGPSPNKQQGTSSIKDRTMTPMRATFSRTATAVTTTPSNYGRTSTAMGGTNSAGAAGSPSGQPRRALSATRNPPAGGGGPITNNTTSSTSGAGVMRVKSPMRSAPTTTAPTTRPTSSTAANRTAASPGPTQRRHADPNATGARGFTHSTTATSTAGKQELNGSMSANNSSNAAAGGGSPTPNAATITSSVNSAHIHPTTTAAASAAATAVDGSWDMTSRMEELMGFKSTNREALDRMQAHPETYTRSRSFTTGAAGGYIRSSSVPAGSQSPSRTDRFHYPSPFGGGTPVPSPQQTSVVPQNPTATPPPAGERLKFTVNFSDEGTGDPLYNTHSSVGCDDSTMSDQHAAAHASTMVTRDNDVHDAHNNTLGTHAVLCSTNLPVTMDAMVSSVDSRGDNQSNGSTSAVDAAATSTIGEEGRGGSTSRSAHQRPMIAADTDSAPVRH